MVRQDKRSIDAASLAHSLLQFAIHPDSPQLEQARSAHYLSELLYLTLFSVDFVLGMMEIKEPGFKIVRRHYNDAIFDFRDFQKAEIQKIIMTRFESYTDACNADSASQKELRGVKIRFWELGKAFSSLASDKQPWIPNALEVALHANIFVSLCADLAKFLGQYDVTEL